MTMKMLEFENRQEQSIKSIKSRKFSEVEALIAAHLSCVISWSWKKLQCTVQTENVAAQHYGTNQA